MCFNPCLNIIIKKMKMNVRVSLLILAAGLITAQSVPNCEHKVGDALTGTYCLSCLGDVCNRCHNGFVDNGRCSPHNITNCYMSEKQADGQVICKICQEGYHISQSYPGTDHNACLLNPTPGTASFKENCTYYSWDTSS